VAVPDSDHPPCGRCSEATPAELHGSGARSTQSVAQAVFLARLLAVERATPNQFRSDTFCRGLVVTPAGEADIPERLYDVPLTNPPGYGNHARFPEQTPLKPVRACFREARPPRKPCFRGAFQGPEPPLIHLREEVDDTPHPRCLPSRGKPELGGYALGKPSATPRPPVRTEILSDGRSRMVWSFLHRLFPACE
jgi:hypothetical protein